MAGAELHVNPTGGPTIVTPFLDVDPNMPDKFAAAAFVEPVPFAVQILDSSGAAVASSSMPLVTAAAPAQLAGAGLVAARPDGKPSCRRLR